MEKKSNVEQQLPSKADVIKFIMLSDFLESAYDEMKDFSKKNPDSVLNERKVNSLNKILTDIKDILMDQPTVSYLELLDREMLPSNSDVVLTMSQYRSALGIFRQKYRRHDTFDTFWHTSEGEIRARDIEK